MIKLTILSTLLTLSLFVQACSQNNDKDGNKQANDMINKNEFVLTGLDAKQYVVTQELNGFKLKDAEGKVVIFDIFATWCPPCRATAPHLSALKKKYKDDLVVIGVTIEDNLPNQKLIDFRKTYGADYTLVNSTQNRRLVNAVTRSLELGNNYPIPIMAIYKDGKLIEKYIGLVEEEFVNSDIKMALGK
jgi:thiol-disulfide isomerase/thioredoxin